MAYQSVHTGPEVDAAVSVLSDVQDIRDEVETNLNTVTTLAGQTATNAGLAQTAATNAQADAASALTSRNEAHSSAQAAAASAAASDAARAQSVVAKNGAEQARDSAWEAEDETRALLSESGPTIDAINAELRRMKYGSGPYPSLELGFVGASMLDRRVTFTRGSNATYWDELGTLQTAGPGEPRFDYDPVTGGSLGLLVEGQATNLFSYSENFEHPVWLKTALAVEPDSVRAPDGTLTADKLVEGVENNVHRARRDGTTVIAGTDYTFSVFLKAAERSKVRISFSGTVFSGAAAGFDLAAGTSSADFGAPAHSIIPVGNGWFRCIATVRAAESGLAGFSPSILLLNNSGSQTYAGDGVSGVYIWGAQFEQGSSATSYIKTEASQVTRAADVPIVSVDGFLFRPEEGTLLVEAVVVPSPVGGFIGRIHQGVNEYIGTGYITSSVISRSSYMRNGGGPVFAQSSGGDIPFGETVKASVSWQGNSFVSSVNGTVSSPSNQPDGPPESPTDIRFATNTSGGPSRNMWLRRAVYFPRRLPDAQLVELTTP